MWDRLMQSQSRYPLQEYAERSVLTTWKLSYVQVQAIKPDAAKLLDQWAFLHPGDFSYELLQPYVQSSQEDGEEAGDTEGLPADSFSFHDSRSILAQYSLISDTVDKARSSIHPVVHDWSFYLRALQGYEEALGPKHTSTLGTVNNLGLLYAGQGKMKEAEEMYTRALQGYEEALGPKHTSTLRTVNNLGLLHEDEHRLNAEEAMDQRVENIDSVLPHSGQQDMNTPPQSTRKRLIRKVAAPLGNFFQSARRQRR